MSTSAAISGSSLALWFANLEAEAKTEVEKLGAEAETLAEKIGKVVVADVEQLLKDLGQMAVKAVLMEAPKLLSGEEKFGNAVQNVYSTAIGLGKNIVVQDAQMAVQGAFKALQLAVS